MSVSTVTSEALQLKLRQLLPSQQGFGTDITASDTIIPIIDLTSSAEGSDTRESLQTAWDFATGHTTVNNGTDDLITTAGFWQVDLNYMDEGVANNAVNPLARLFLDDGASEKTIWQVTGVNSSSANESRGFSDNRFVVFLRSGDTLKGFSSSTRSSLDVWYRQVADTNGVLTQPLGFTPQ